jgi:hypothetical protein
MLEQFSTTVDLAELLQALSNFSSDRVRLTIDDRSALTVEPVSSAPITIQEES